jgi:hypothetical protein
MVCSITSFICRPQADVLLEPTFASTINQYTYRIPATPVQGSMPPNRFGQVSPFKNVQANIAKVLSPARTAARRRLMLTSGFRMSLTCICNTTLTSRGNNGSLKYQ